MLLEYEKCAIEPVYFFHKYVYIEDSNNARACKWESWGYLLDLIEDFKNNKEIIILKARQLGISWLVSAYALWKALFHDNVTILMFSNLESSAWELINKCKFIYRRLPPFLKRETSKESRGAIEFKNNESRILAFPSTAEAGSGYNATLVIRDELVMHPYADENLSSVGPAIDSGEGQLIDLSSNKKVSVGKDKVNPHFIERYKAARSGENSAKAVFLSWKLRPNRSKISQDEWFERIKKKYPPWQVEQEYPETEDQAMSSISLQAFFDIEATNDMLLHFQPTLEERHGGQIKIWKRPITGRRYCAFLDPSDGKEDPHCGIVMDSRTYEIVAFTWGKCPADRACYQFAELCREYNDAYNEFECNALAGGKASQTLDDLGLKNRRVSGSTTNGSPKYGWYTTSTSRNTMLYGLEEAIRGRLIVCHDKDAIQEIQAFQQPPDSPPCAGYGMHDDFVLALAGCWQILREMPMSTEFKTLRCEL